jgi:alpha-galactosidase
VPGLWIAPFVVGNRSRLYQEHPDWVVQDRQTGGPLVQMRFYGEFRWHKRSEECYILDATHPDALDYLRRVFHVWRHEWGCEYFKTDFMFFGAEYGPERARWHTAGMTRIEVWRRVALMIREEIGDALWLGCGFPLWAAIGLADALRIAGDMGVEWIGERSARALLGVLMLRNFANRILCQADPDCVLLRSRFHHLSDDEIRSLALYAGMSGGVLTTSDALHELPPERIELLRLLLTVGADECRYPLLGQTDPVVVQVQDAVDFGGENLTAVNLFNTGDETVSRLYTLVDLGISAPAIWWDTASGTPAEQGVSAIDVSLKPHESKLFWLKTR